jgi:hypothetical protein
LYTDSPFAKGVDWSLPLSCGFDPMNQPRATSSLSPEASTISNAWCAARSRGSASRRGASLLADFRWSGLRSAAKTVLILLMWAGRLELLPVLVLATRSYWSR